MSAAVRRRRRDRRRINRAARRLETLYAQASRETIAEGRAWYPRAFAEARELAPDAPERAAAVIAALSPQTRWRENVAGARALLSCDPLAVATLALPGYRSNHAKAAAIAHAGAPFGQGPGDAFGAEAPKVRAFFAAIVGDLASVTLDVWAMRAAYPRWNGRPPSGAAYRRGVAAYRLAAERCGEHARDFQAIIWLHVRGMREHARDASAIGQGRLFPSDAPARMPVHA